MEERAAEERTTEERTVEKRAAEERVADESAAEERAAEERSAEERAAEERAAKSRTRQPDPAALHAASTPAQQRSAKQLDTDGGVGLSDSRGLLQIPGAKFKRLEPDVSSVGSWLWFHEQLDNQQKVSV